MPAIIQILEYNPLPLATSLPERLVRHRISLGLSQKESATRLAVDPSTLARWERGERAPTLVFLERVERFLDSLKPTLVQARRAG